MSAWSNDPSVATTICNAAGNQYGLRLIKVIDGYIVVWQDERRVYRDIYAQKFDVAGNMKWPDNGRVIAAGNNGEASNHLLYNSQSLSGIVSDTQGGAIVLWTEDYSCQSGPCGNVWITRVHSNGDVQWGMPPSPGVTIQGTDTAVLLNQHGGANAIAPDGEGGAFGIFGVDAWGDWYVFRMDSNGAFRSMTPNVVGARGGAHLIYGGNSNGKDYVNIAWWDYGDFAISIEDPEVNYPASTDTLYALWNKITLSSTPSWWSEPLLISDGAGGAIIVWEDSRNVDSDIFAQKISADGSVQWTASGVPIAVQPANQRRPQLVSDGSGGAVVVWEDSRGPGTQTYAQHIDSGGSTQWTENGILLSQRSGLAPQIIKSADGNYIVVYADNDSNGGTPDYLRAQKISPGGVLLGDPGGTVITNMGGPDDFQIASDGDGGVIVIWAWGDIYAQRVLSIPPDTSITDGPNGTITFNNPTFTYTGTDNVTPTANLVYATYLQGYDSDWSSFSSSTAKSYSNLANGFYTFMVKARDATGNEDPTPATRSFIVNYAPWTQIPGAIYDPPALAWNPVANKLQMVVRGGGDSIWAGTFDSNGTFNNDWVKIPGAILDPPALAWNPNAGKMQMVVRGGGNTIWACSLSSSGAFNNDWVKIPGTIFDPPALAWNDVAGKMQMVVRGGGNSIWAATFSNSGPTISFDGNWTQIPGAILSAPALAWIPAPTNKMWMLVQGGGNTIWKASFGTSGSTISFDGNWTQIPGAIFSPPALDWNPNYSGVGSGRMQMVVRGGGDSIWAATFDSGGIFNNDWTHIPGGTPSSPGMVYLPSINFMCIVVRGLDNSIWRTLY
jgi:hypothetical protein